MSQKSTPSCFAATRKLKVLRRLGDLAKIMHNLEKSIKDIDSNDVLNHTDFLSGMGLLNGHIEEHHLFFKEKIISLVLAYTELNKKRTNEADNMDAIDEMIVTGLKLRKKVYKYLKKALESEIIGENYLSWYPDEGEISPDYHKVDMIQIYVKMVELHDRNEGTWISLERFIQDYKNWHTPKPKQYSPEAKELQANLSENNMFFRVGHIVEIGESQDDEHEAIISKYRGESYVVIVVDKERETYRLTTLKNYMEAESIDLCQRVGIDPGTEFYDADFKYPKEKPAERKKDTQNELDAFEGIHTGLIKTYCEVCESAWAGTLVPVKYPHYACSSCRENDSGITFGNSIEFDNAEDYGND